MSLPLPDGVYESLVTQALERAIGEATQGGRSVQVEDLSSVEGTSLLVRHLATELVRRLGPLPAEEQLELCNRVLAAIGATGPEATIAVGEARQALLAVYRDATKPPRPQTPLSLSGLLTGAEGEPRLGSELETEIATADRIDALVSFVTWEGWRRMSEAFQRFALDQRPLRLMTTTYTGATEAEAVEALAKLPGAQVRISYDGRRTRLHAKAWLFHRRSGFSTAYVGSANLSRVALSGGLEWTVKAGQADLQQVLEKFGGTFDTLWESGEFEPFDATSEVDRARLRAALDKESGRKRDGATPAMLLVTVAPYPFQQAMLDLLEAERTIHGRCRNLVVAATGTGKTMLAAFDYRRLVPPSGVRPRLLFVAHREELLLQALQTYRLVLRDQSFGSLLGGGQEPDSFDHLFTTVQSFRSRRLVERLGKAHWSVVVVDECHRSAADTYSDLVERLQPSILLGLTATPERADGASILPYFEGRPAAELRLWDALENQLLAPFEYYGLADGTDLTAIRWTRGAYDVADLEKVYTGNDRRAALVIEQFQRWRGRVLESRALGFCVSVGHAEFMARKFNEAGIPAVAIHGGSPDALRQDAPLRLERRGVNVIFTCDLYNEGVDLPFVDTLLLLRPTSSPTVFLQQLGRGLRIHPGKSTCLVLDFIGQSHEQFRFDRALTALTGLQRGQLRSAVELGFPTLPSGCHLKLDKVSRQIILESLRAALGGGLLRLAKELRAGAEASGGDIELAQFLEETGRPLEDVYATGSFTALRRLAGLPTEPAGPDEDALGRRVSLLAHIDDPARLALYGRLVRGELGAVGHLGLADRRRLLMLGYQLYRETARVMTPEQATSLFDAHPALRTELRQLLGLLQDRVLLAPTAGLPDDWALSVHRTYSRREAQTAVGDWTETAKPSSREGVRRVGADTELLFVTLVKEEKHFSPSTRYRDFAISPSLFHWQSQANTGPDSMAGRRYLEQATNGNRFLLFVRKHKGEEFHFLGPVKYVSHEGSRPMSITWRLEYPMPAALYQAFATLMAA
jgi:superfamily II DNA or RNA helicase/HKD family nuclease